MSFVCTILGWILYFPWTPGSLENKPYWCSKSNGMGACVSSAGCWAGGPYGGLRSLAPREDLCNCNYLPILDHPPRGTVLDCVVSLLLPSCLYWCGSFCISLAAGLFSACLVAFPINSFFVNSCFGVCMEGGDLRLFLLCQVSHSSPFNFFFFFAMLHSLQDLSSHSRDWTHVLCSGSTESYPRDCQRIPSFFFF